MRVEIVVTSARLDELGLSWDLLWRRTGCDVFQSHGWVSAWWRSKPASDRSKLCIGLCWAQDNLIAVIPCTTRWHRGVRVLEWTAKKHSDYCDAMLDPAFRDGEAALALIWKEIGKSGAFDIVYLSHVRPDATVRLLLVKPYAGSVRLRLGQRSDKTLQVRRDAASGHAWFRGLSRKARSNHARGMRIVGESGAVKVRTYQPGQDMDVVLEQMIMLKRQWLVSTGESNPFLDDDAWTLQALIAELTRQHLVRVFSIHCNDALVAASVNITQGSRLQTYFAILDPQFERASPGTLILVEGLIWAFDHGISEVDFLCVDEKHRYKFATDQVHLATYVGARTWVGKMALAVGEQLDQRRASRIKADTLTSVAAAKGLSIA